MSEWVGGGGEGCYENAHEKRGCNARKIVRGKSRMGSEQECVRERFEFSIEHLNRFFIKWDSAQKTAETTTQKSKFWKCLMKIWKHTKKWSKFLTYDRLNKGIKTGILSIVPTSQHRHSDEVFDWIKAKRLVFLTQLNSKFEIEHFELIEFHREIRDMNKKPLTDLIWQLSIFKFSHLTLSVPLWNRAFVIRHWETNASSTYLVAHHLLDSQSES